MPTQERISQPKAEARMPPFRHILVSLDGSELAAAALGPAVGIAALCGAEVTLFMVIPPIDDAIEGPGERIAIDAQWEIRRERARDYLAALCRRPECEGVRLNVEVAMGRAAETILDYARDHAVDLIVMTTHGRSGVRRWVWGSIAEKVLRAAQTTVLLVRSAAEPSLARE